MDTIFCVTKKERHLDCTLTVREQKYDAKIYLTGEFVGKIDFKQEEISEEMFFIFAQYLVAAAAIQGIVNPFIVLNSESRTKRREDRIKKAGFKWFFTIGKEEFAYYRHSQKNPYSNKKGT